MKVIKEQDLEILKEGLKVINLCLENDDGDGAGYLFDFFHSLEGVHFIETLEKLTK